MGGPYRASFEPVLETTAQGPGPAGTHEMGASGDYDAWLMHHPNALEFFDRIVLAMKGRRVVVFLDYDGTLTPIVRDPDEAHVSEKTRATVRALARAVPTAIVSGRGREKVQEFLGLSELYYAGSHGMDIVGPCVDEEGMGPEVAEEVGLRHRDDPYTQSVADFASGLVPLTARRGAPAVAPPAAAAEGPSASSLARELAATLSVSPTPSRAPLPEPPSPAPSRVPLRESPSPAPSPFGGAAPTSDPSTAAPSPSLPSLSGPSASGPSTSGPSASRPSTSGAGTPSPPPLRSSKSCFTFQPAACFASLIDEVHSELLDGVRDISGASVEHNKFCLSVHFRNCSLDGVERVRELVANVAALHDDELRVTRGRKVLEIRPKINWDKGYALLHLLKAMGLSSYTPGEPGRAAGSARAPEEPAQADTPLPAPASDAASANRGPEASTAGLSPTPTSRAPPFAIYLGDDTTDEDAFQALASSGLGDGIVVSTRPKPSAAAWSLRDPDDVTAFLAALEAWALTADNLWSRDGKCLGWRYRPGVAGHEASHEPPGLPVPGPRR